MYIPRLSSAIFFILGLILSCLGAYFYNGYYKLKQSGEDVTYFRYVKSEISNINQGMQELPDITAEAYKSADDITIESMQKIQQALLMYNLNTETYPKKIEELLGIYLNEDNKIILQESFEYKKTTKGYYMSVVLPVSKKKYIIEE